MAVPSPSPSLSPAAFELRLAEPGDFDAYMDAFSAVAAEGRWLGAEAPVDRTSRRAGFDKAVAGDDAVLYLASSSENGSVAGALNASVSGGVVDLGMFVADGWRGGGVGSALLEAVIAWAREQGAHKVSLAAWPTNSPALALYARHGFRIEGTRRRHYRRRSGALWDSVVMGLILDSSSSGGPGPAQRVPPSIVVPPGGIVGVLGGGGARIVVREWHRSDIPALVAAIDGMEGREWLQAIPCPYTASDASDYLAFSLSQLTAGAAAELAVVVDGSLAGAVGLRIVGPDRISGEIGYWVAASARGQGVATAATRLLSDFGFGSLGLVRIELNAAVANAASRRVAEKAGFELEGIRRAWRLVDGVPTDHCIYSRLARPA